MIQKKRSLLTVFCREGLKDGAKTKTFNVKSKDTGRIAQMDYMKTEKYKTLYKKRYKIEAKKLTIKK